MTVKLEAIVRNKTYPLSGGNPWHFIALTGVGLPPIRNVRSRGYGQVGSSRVGYDIGERTLRLALICNAPSHALADKYRDELAEALQPLSRTPIQLRMTREDGKVRQVDCYSNGTIDFPLTLQERMGTSQRVIVELEALQPMPYDPVTQVLRFSGLVPGGYLVPVFVPYTQGLSTDIDVVETVNYAGQWRTSPTIVISGPITDPYIENLTTGEVLDLTGVTINSGDYYTITTGYGRQSVTDSTGANKIAELSPGSDLATFHLAAHPEAANGKNDIAVKGSDVSGITSVALRWHNYYLSF